MSDSLELDLDPLPIDFTFVRRLQISWFPWLRFCGRCRNLEFTIIVVLTQTTGLLNHLKPLLCYVMLC